MGLFKAGFKVWQNLMGTPGGPMGIGRDIGRAVPADMDAAINDKLDEWFESALAFFHYEGRSACPYCRKGAWNEADLSDHLLTCQSYQVMQKAWDEREA